jgi:hypothetical protein
MREAEPIIVERTITVNDGSKNPVGYDDIIKPILKLNDLSMQEREQGLQDLHGVSDLQQEDPHFIQQHLAELKLELRMGSDESEDRELIKFLRAETFDSRKAAARYHRFQELQMNLFGKRGNIRYSDLSEQDIKFLKSGFMQLLPQRDRAGRAIMICIGSIKQQLRTPLDSDVRKCGCGHQNVEPWLCFYPYLTDWLLSFFPSFFLVDCYSFDVFRFSRPRQRKMKKHKNAVWS